MKKAYKKENTLSAATRILVQELFADYGLLIIDGDHKALKTEIKAVFKEELLYQKLFNTTKETVSNLKKTYGKVQVNPRDINLFYLSKTRDRIELRNDLYIDIAVYKSEYDKYVKAVEESNVLEEFEKYLNIRDLEK